MTAPLPYPDLPPNYLIPTAYVDEFSDSTLAEGIFTTDADHSQFVQRDAATYNPGGGVTPPGRGPASSPYIGEMRFPAGFVAGSAPSHLYSGNLTANGWTHLYFAVTVQLSSNWSGQSAGVNKVMIAWIHNNPCLVLSATGFGTGPLTWQFRLQNLGVGNGEVNLGPNLADGTVTRGRWQRVEVEAIANTPGVQDGALRMWLTTYNSSGRIVSGPTKIAEYTDVGWSSASQADIWSELDWYPIWGGVGGTVPVTQYQWMDRLALGGR